MKEISTTCPACGSDRVVPIRYGLPGADMQLDYDDGNIELGGCLITDDDPRWACQACDARWG